MQEPQLEVAPPFPGPIAVPTQRGLGTIEAVASFALAGLGIGFGIAAFRHMRKLGKIQCAPEMLEDESYGMPIVGVDVNYEGDWWKDRGQRLYWQARRQGATTAEQIGLAIIAADIGQFSECIGQFPPHANTHPQNVELWQNLMTYVQQQMAEERGLT